VERHGVVAVGDSLLTGFGPALGGVSAQSWAAWVAWALADCTTVHAVNGAHVAQVVADQLPLLEGRYRIGLACCGANDYADFDPALFGSQLEQICLALRRHTDLAAVATLPLRLRVPQMSWRSTESLTRRLNTVVREVTHDCEALVVDLEPGLTGRWSMAPDGQHPSSVGQLEAARIAAATLDLAGLRFSRHLPDPGQIRLSEHDRRLYVRSVRDRLRGTWSSLRSYRADRAAGAGRG